jgi:hypothetical protein
MIKSGREIMGTANSHLHAQIKAIDDQNAEILAVVKPIMEDPVEFEKNAEMQEELFTLVTELEALNGK